MSNPLMDDVKNIDFLDVKIDIDGDFIPLYDLIFIYKKSKKLKKSLNKSSLKYYHKNSDNILRRMKINRVHKHNCTCGAIVYNKSQHLKSKKHFKYSNENENKNKNENEIKK